MTRTERVKVRAEKLSHELREIAERKAAMRRLAGLNGCRMDDCPYFWQDQCDYTPEMCYMEDNYEDFTSVDDWDNDLDYWPDEPDDWEVGEDGWPE